MNILVTGGAGYIGSHTCVELLQAGHKVIIADNFSNSKSQVLQAIEAITGKKPVFYQIDVADYKALKQLFCENDIDGAIHFAGYKAVGESVQKPLSYYQNNFCTALTLAQVMQEEGVFRLVFSSSATVYGIDNPIPYKEEYPTGAVNPYGRTKVMIEQMLTDLAASDRRWSIALLRYFNPIGAHPSGLLGEDPNGIPNNLLPYIAKVAAGQLPHLNVFGDDYDTRDGTGVRDYLHVVDLAEGHLAAMDYMMEHNGVEAVNLGTGQGSSVIEVLHAFEQACGKQLPYQIAPRRPGDIGEYYAHPGKAERLFGWKAKRSLQQMCADSWRYTCRQNNL
ncbi:MAG: UDP-glucose 4-epimerase GalE [Oscillospiraceae bacterium]|nr:UDP-glucose 4-epimerase GalE [Oscillospiraceae bacterium]